ncbi:AP-3 complex subunit beta-2 [Desmophyllum pertusum]|uniref:AP-3 complex subunit beta-2 n=1 Tax=Desmophyllum pertusum TaxID=174260 RepID=A0A9W9ZYU3_9CNID|nr:AP-3 complex subunit beta-2 [Desmophyllum pertusum]
MMADGRDMSDLFAAVVKKLVYLYLVRYAEEQQDLALLSISTFQKGLKDPNQLIRGSALRVLSGIRVPVIAPIMMLAIKERLEEKETLKSYQQEVTNRLSADCASISVEEE